MSVAARPRSCSSQTNIFISLTPHITNASSNASYWLGRPSDSCSVTSRW